MSEIKCPQCATDNVQRVEVAYLQGSSSINAVSKTMGVGIGRGGGRWGAGVGGARTNTTGTSQSLLAESLSPPTKVKWIIPITIMIGGMLFFFYRATPSGLLIRAWFFVLLGIVTFVAAVLYALWVYRQNKHHYPIALEEWRKNWICQKCGDVFVPRQLQISGDNRMTKCST